MKKITAEMHEETSREFAPVPGLCQGSEVRCVVMGHLSGFLGDEFFSLVFLDNVVSVVASRGKQTA